MFLFHSFVAPAIGRFRSSDLPQIYDRKESEQPTVRQDWMQEIDNAV